MVPEAILKSMFARAVARAAPGILVPGSLPEPPAGRTFVAGAGKAAAAMAAAFDGAWPGPLTGIAVTRYGHGCACGRIEVIEAGHPLPDEAGHAAAARILEEVRGLGAEDLFVFLVSGGGSALLTLPTPGMTMADKRAATDRLLRSGAAIGEINTVRRHLSAIKGGRLAAAAAPARVVTLGISDVPGDDPTVIASGPTVPDPTTADDARRVLAKYGLPHPPGLAESPRLPAPSDYRLIATPRDSLAAAAEAGGSEGLPCHILSDRIEGEAREVAKVMAALALHARAGGGAFHAPCILLSGGETTVTVRGKGSGGRNLEFLLALGLALEGAPGIHALSCDTDGIDGDTSAAGALLRPDSMPRARALGLDPAACLADNDAYRVFDVLGDLIVTGPTLTNVNDFRAILIEI